MSYFMSLDGGGTKLYCLVSDQDGGLCGYGLGGSVNSNFNRPEEIENAIAQAIGSALAVNGLAGREITAVYCAMPVALDIVSKAIKIHLHSLVHIRFISESTMSLYASIQKEEGGVTLSGTGSFAMAKTSKKLYHVGGYGSLFSDEGSGYYIGCKALASCLHMIDEIGPSTLLYTHVMESLERINRKHIVDIYSLATGEQRRFIASICKLVGSCAHQGDEISIKILEDAAERLAFLTNGLLTKCGDEIPPGFPVTISGGVWKAHPIVFSSFKGLIKLHHPYTDIKAPLFEPVIGGILLAIKERDGTVSLPRFKKEYSNFLYPPLI